MRIVPKGKTVNGDYYRKSILEPFIRDLRARDGSEEEKSETPDLTKVEIVRDVDNWTFQQVSCSNSLSHRFSFAGWSLTT